MGEFKTVNYKRKSRVKNVKANNCLSSSSTEDSLPFDKEKLIRKIENSKTQVFSSEFYESVRALLVEGLGAIEKRHIEEIICLGLGKINEEFTAQCQFGLLLCLKDLYKVKVTVYDPVFNDRDIDLLKHFEISVLEDNFEGKFKAGTKVTLFYMPHCPKQLSNNLLFTNWGLNLKNCVIFANSFGRIIESTNKRDLEQTSDFILNIYPYTLELTVVNNFKYNQVFNDSSIHFFPTSKLSLIASDFWGNPKEPKYSDECVEFITKKLQENKI